MSTEVITGNDLKAILNEVLPPTASEYRKLIYSGVLVSGEATLSESVTNFDQVMINAEDNDGVKKTFIINVRSNGVFSTYLDFDRITTMWYVKSMLLSFNGINISIVSNAQAYDGGEASSSSCVAVTEIYGIKYERVAPPLTDMEWKEAGRTTSTSDWIDLPATATEVNLIAVVGGTIYSGYRSLAEPITSVTTWMFGGYYAGASDFGYANVNMRNNGRSFQKRHFFYTGTSYDSAATLIVYYR